jgi:type III pantothenate kinase
MLLAIDCGNTNTIFSIWNGTKFVSSWRTATDHQRTADQYFVWLSTLMSLQNIKADITDVIISSTVPRVVFNLRVLSDRYYNTRPIVVGKPECQIQIEVRVDVGTAVGNLIIVDFGTATTFDVVDHDGAYVGGVIAPGVNLSLQALHQMAAALPHVDIAKPKQVIGKNTVSCMQSGVFWGYIGLVKEICRKIKEEKKETMKVVATGGLSPLLQSTEALFENVDENLTMQGLRLIFDYNKSI